MNAQAQRLDTIILGPAGTRSSKVLNIMGAPVLIKASGQDTDDKFAIMHVTVPPMSGPPLHRHSLEDEFFYVLDGEITWEVDGRRISGGAGTSAFAPRGTAHAFQNFSKETAHMIVQVTPAGLDRFFEDVAGADRAQAEEIMNSYGIELLGPPLS